jgi:cytochrome c peroxidase
LSEKTGKASDLGRFRTPSQRNVALTAPYWHDGSARTLAEAIDRHRLNVTANDRAQLIAFLDALTDEDFVTRKSLGLPMTACGRKL